MRIAALLPHVEVFGGVRRYLELGNELVRRGHSFVLFHPEGGKPGWLAFRGEARPWAALDQEAFDVGLCSEYSILPFFDKLRAKTKYFYFVLAGHKQEREAARKPYFFLANSEGLCRRLRRKYGLDCFKAAGGVNPEIFYPAADPEERPAGEIRILCYGRLYKKRKGIQQAVKAVNGLASRYPRLKLILFDTRVGQDRRDPRPLLKTRLAHEFHLDLPQDRLAPLFSRADIFVSAERRAGWANTAAEAMACRVAVVCTSSGTRDFAFPGQTALVVPWPLPFLLRRAIERLIRDRELRLRLAEAGYRQIQEFTWSGLASRLERHFLSKLNLQP
ncbi:MAG: glycosyltransferase family 4 protein [Candidatus Aminicenantales bacterium]